MAYLRLCNSSYVRQYDDIAYICNQVTRHDRVYDISGGVFLKAIRREPRTIEDAVSEIASAFNVSDVTSVRDDFLEFISDLESDLFVV